MSLIEQNKKEVTSSSLWIPLHYCVNWLFSSSKGWCIWGENHKPSAYQCSALKIACWRQKNGELILLTVCIDDKSLSKLDWKTVRHNYRPAQPTFSSLWNTGCFEDRVSRYCTIWEAGIGKYKQLLTVFQLPTSLVIFRNSSGLHPQ